MSIISEIGRKSWKVRLLLGSIYVIIIVGALTMVYPFMLMVAGTTKSAVDTPEAEIIPRFLTSNQALYRKDSEAFFNESLKDMQSTYSIGVSSFRTLDVPVSINYKLTDEWRCFLQENNFPFYFYTLAYLRAPISKKTLPLTLREFKASLYDKYSGDLGRMNRELGTDFVNWNSFYVLPESYLHRRNRPGMNPFDEVFRKFKAAQPVEKRYYASPEGYFLTAYLFSQYGKDIKGYNKAHGTKYMTWDEVKLTRRFPGKSSALERKDWNIFVRFILNLYWIRADETAKPVYQAYLKARYGTLASLNKNYGTAYKTFSDVPLIKEPPLFGMALSDWDAFIQGWKDPDTGKLHQLPIDMIHIYSIDFLFRDWLKNKYKTLAKANTALQTKFKSGLDISPPQQDFNYLVFQKQTGTLRREYVKRNYISVIEYIVLHGRGILNTMIYCSLAVLSALIINPLAAYALSRYKPPSAYKILLFLMLTMAFPPMVTQIPIFLMLREFNLLNSFFALILPGIANGYSIFLLKGFFDSLPQELYESAELDGAGEFRIFWQITMSLSKPILAVIGLNAFTLAYSNFMMALLICQDQKMWTLMPWLYQLQQNGSQGVIFASLVIAAIPTFLIFAFCQNIIMRGIVVPVEK
ncbi:MAG: ABC transporter permease subunit [Victivallales bacterium]